MKRNVYFVSGTGTGIGKSYATGYIAGIWNGKGIRTITQKLIQTGNREISEDIELHRRIMGCPLLPEDIQKLTMPEIFSYPCSPHLASRIDGRSIDFEKIKKMHRYIERAFRQSPHRGGRRAYGSTDGNVADNRLCQTRELPANIGRPLGIGKHKPYSAKSGGCCGKRNKTLCVCI